MNIRNKGAGVASYELQAENTSKFIHFFGIKLQWKYEDIVRNIYSLPAFLLWNAGIPLSFKVMVTSGFRTLSNSAESNGE